MILKCCFPPSMILTKIIYDCINSIECYSVDSVFINYFYVVKKRKNKHDIVHYTYCTRLLMFVEVKICQTRNEEICEMC